MRSNFASLTALALALELHLGAAPHAHAQGTRVSGRQAVVPRPTRSTAGDEPCVISSPCGNTISGRSSVAPAAPAAPKTRHSGHGTVIVEATTDTSVSPIFASNFNQGWYRDFFNGFSGEPGGIHSPGNSNYVVGEASDELEPVAFYQYYNFFSFDVSALLGSVDPGCVYDLKVTSAQLRFVEESLSQSKGRFSSSDDALYTLRSVPTKKYSASELKLTTEDEDLDLTLEIVEYLSPESIRRATQIYGACGEKDQTGCEMLASVTVENPQLIPLNKYATRDITRTLRGKPNDQEVPDAKFWSIGGFRPSLQGFNAYFGFSGGAPVFLDVVLEYKERSRCKGGGKGDDHHV